ncbi:HAD family hydrolase [Thalassotalea euphylliae]|uniref:HAD family hydrolase n=1 Tax=Thalassotalea euphylliae TaxID=1655234 RepID=UPI00362A2F0F
MDNYKLYIFDWDGTLMDSIGRIVSSLQAAARALSLEPPTDEAAKSIIGLSLVPAIERLFPLVTESQTEQLIAEYRQQYLHENTVPSPMFEHVDVMLGALRSQGKLVAVATGKNRPGLNKMLSDTNTGEYFHQTICACEAESKPNPRMLEILLQDLGVETHEALMIGDSIHDLTMANNAGIDSVGITLGADTKKSLEKCQPNVIVDSISELIQLLTGAPVHSHQNV